MPAFSVLLCVLGIPRWVTVGQLLFPCSMMLVLAKALGGDLKFAGAETYWLVIPLLLAREQA